MISRCLGIFILALSLNSCSISTQGLTAITAGLALLTSGVDAYAQSAPPSGTQIHSLTIATGLQWPCDGLWHTQTVKVPHGIKIYGGFTTVGSIATWLDWEIWTPGDLLMHIPKVESVRSWDLLQTPPEFVWFYPAYFTSYNDTVALGGWCSPDGQWTTANPPVATQWMMGGAVIYYAN